MFIFGLRSTSDDWLSNPSNESQLKCGKMSPKSSNNEMLIFGLHSTCDDQLSNLSKKHWRKRKKMKKAPKSLKNEMFIFGLRSTSDDRLSNPSKKMSTKTQKKTKKGPLSHWKIKCSFLDYVQLLMIGWAGRGISSQQKMLMKWAGRWKLKPHGHEAKKNESFWIMFNLWWSDQWLKCKNRPPKSSNMKCSVLDYVQLLMIIWAIGVTKFDWNVKKGPPSHHKMKCSFLDYVQLLIIGWAIRAMKVDWNVTKGPLSHRTLKCSFLDYIQLVMIGQAIRVMKVDQNGKKWNVVSVRVFCCFS